MDNVPEGYEVASLNQFTPQQNKLFGGLFSHVGKGSYLERLAGGDEELFNQIEKPALKQFGQLQGGLASRFSGMGSFGARRSSGFQNTANQAATDFATQLQGQRQQLQRQALTDMMQFSQMLLGQRPQERSLVAPQQQQSALSAWAPVVGSAIGTYFGGPAGAAAGNAAGNIVAGGISSGPS